MPKIGRFCLLREENDGMAQFAGAETFVRRVKNPRGAIVYAHSFMGRFQHKEALAERYPDYDYFALNLPGHGASPLVADIQAQPGYGLCLLQSFLEFHDVRNAVMVGHSLGGGMIAALNGLIPERIALNVLETPACGIMRANAEIIGKLIPHGPADAETVFNAMYADAKKTFGSHYERAREMAFAASAAAYAAYAPTIKPPLINVNGDAFDAGFAAIRVPTLVILGEKDGIIPAEPTRAHLAKVNPRIEFAVVKNAGHVVYFEKRDEFLSLLDAFVNKHYHAAKQG